MKNHRFTTRKKTPYEHVLGRYVENLVIDKKMSSEEEEIARFDYLKHMLNKLGEFEDFVDWFSSLTFYGKALNMPGQILPLKFERFDFRPYDNEILLHFEIDGPSKIMYSLFDYGRIWSIRKSDLTEDN